MMLEKDNGMLQKSMQKGQFYDDGTLRVTAFRIGHIDVSYAFLAEAEGKRVLFTGDLSHKDPQEDFPFCVAQNGNRLDLTVCERFRTI